MIMSNLMLRSISKSVAAPRALSQPATNCSTSSSSSRAIMMMLGNRSRSNTFGIIHRNFSMMQHDRITMLLPLSPHPESLSTNSRCSNGCNPMVIRLPQYRGIRNRARPPPNYRNATKKGETTMTNNNNNNNNNNNIAAKDKFNPSITAATMAKEEEEDDEEEEWIPPEHSPLLSNTNAYTTTTTTQHEEYSPLMDREINVTNNSNNASPSLEEYDDEGSFVEGEIDVIDLESTLRNRSNQQYLKDSPTSSSSSTTTTTTTMEDPSSFQVQVGNMGWNQILKELQASGEDSMITALVKEYGLQDHLAALEEENDITTEDSHVTSTSRENVNDTNDHIDEEWDEEFYSSLENLSPDELIDEIIENSPHLSQLEMEILSEELEKQQLTDERNDLDELDLNESAVYMEFRSMVLEDYNEKMEMRNKTLNKTRGDDGDDDKKRIDSLDKLAATEDDDDSIKKSAFSEYPPDWKDYDSKSAFERDFLKDEASVTPPSSGFIPSRSQGANDSNDAKQGGGISSKESATTDSTTVNFDNTIDWLQARRSRLGDTSSADETTNAGDSILQSNPPTHMVTTKQAESFRHQNSQIQIVPYTLFTTAELSSSLTAQGGSDIRIIDTSEFGDKYGVGIGCDSLLIVTGRNSSHIRVLAESVVRNLKARKLNERGVVGATGHEGGKNPFSTKRARNRSNRNGGDSTSAKIDDAWMVVDCGNVHVHILESVTRECLNIEGMWDLSNPNSEGSKLRNINCNDDDQVDTYVAEHPVPEEYSARMMYGGEGGRGGGSWITGGIGGRVESIPVFTRKSFSEKWSPGRGGKGKGKMRRGR